MKRLNYFCLFFVFLFFIVHSTYAQSFYSLSMEKSNGVSSMSSMQGKKVLLIAAAVDTSISLENLDELQKNYPDLVVIELPIKGLAKARNHPKTNNKTVIVAKETADSTDTNGQLLSWLTRKEGNRHFVVEKLEVGQKFFIDGKGELYAVLPADFKLTDPRINAILTRTSFIDPTIK